MNLINCNCKNQLNSTTHIYFSSLDREQYWNSTPSNCRIKIRRPIEPSTAKISFSQIPDTYFNITNKKNYFEYNGGGITVPEGSYTLNELITELNNLTGLTINLDTNNFILTISDAANFSLDFNFDNSIGKLLGFNPSLTYTGLNSYTAQFQTKIYNNAIFCVSNLGASPIQTSSNLQNVSFVIPHNSNKSEIVQFYAHTQFNLMPIVKKQIHSIVDFKFFDENGDLLKNMGEWVLMIEFR